MDQEANQREELMEELTDLVAERVKQKQDREKATAFVQVFERNMKVFRTIIRENAVAAEVFYFFIEHMDRTNSLVCSYKTMEEVTGRSRMTLYRAITFLKERRFIDTSKMGNINVYHVNSQIAWKSYENGRRYAQFNATVLLSESEQEDFVESSGIRQVETHLNEED